MKPILRCVPLAELAQHLPASTPRTTGEQRRAAVAVREARLRRREPAA